MAGEAVAYLQGLKATYAITKKTSGRVVETHQA